MSFSEETKSPSGFEGLPAKRGYKETRSQSNTLYRMLRRGRDLVGGVSGFQFDGMGIHLGSNVLQLAHDGRISRVTLDYEGQRLNIGAESGQKICVVGNRQFLIIELGLDIEKCLIQFCTHLFQAPYFAKNFFQQTDNTTLEFEHITPFVVGIAWRVISSDSAAVSGVQPFGSASHHNTPHP